MCSLSEAVETVQRWLEDWKSHGYGYWIIIQSDTSEIIGVGGIRPHEWGNRDVLNLYYRFAPKAWGHGYATGVALIAVEMGHHHLSPLPIVARIRPTNTASIRVAERAGLEHQPDLDTDAHMVFSMDWSESFYPEGCMK